MYGSTDAPCQDVDVDLVADRVAAHSLIASVARSFPSLPVLRRRPGGSGTGDGQTCARAAVATRTSAFRGRAALSSLERAGGASVAGRARRNARRVAESPSTRLQLSMFSNLYERINDRFLRARAIG